MVQLGEKRTPKPYLRDAPTMVNNEPRTNVFGSFGTLISFIAQATGTAYLVREWASLLR